MTQLRFVPRTKFKLETAHTPDVTPEYWDAILRMMPLTGEVDDEDFVVRSIRCCVSTELSLLDPIDYSETVNIDSGAGAIP